MYANDRAHDTCSLIFLISRINSNDDGDAQQLIYISPLNLLVNP